MSFLFTIQKSNLWRIDFHKYETYYCLNQGIIFVGGRRLLFLSSVRSFNLVEEKLEEKTNNNNTCGRRHSQHYNAHLSWECKIYNLIENSMYFFKISQTFNWLDLHCLRQKTVTQSDKGLAKITEGASPRPHAETSLVEVKDTHLMNNKLPPAEMLCGEWQRVTRPSDKKERRANGVVTFTKNSWVESIWSCTFCLFHTTQK